MTHFLNISLLTMSSNYGGEFEASIRGRDSAELQLLLGKFSHARAINNLNPDVTATQFRYPWALGLLSYYHYSIRTPIQYRFPLQCVISSNLTATSFRNSPTSPPRNPLPNSI